jgi:hypothetical protein
VASRVPRTSARLVEEKKRKAVALGRFTKQRKRVSGLATTTESYLIEKGEDNKEQSDLVLIYNIVRVRVSSLLMGQPIVAQALLVLSLLSSQTLLPS